MSELLELIKQQEPTFLQKAKHGGYVCPVCGNGTGANATGITRTRGKQTSIVLDQSAGTIMMF